jgi:delta 1-pyrroline-5-carboxylate dehydrogenase
VDNRSTIAQEEIIGPVLSIISYTDEDDAVRLANEPDYGLGGSVWTADPARARHVVHRVRTGTMGINGYLPDPAGPWGGVKSSGLGRELGLQRLDLHGPRLRHGPQPRVGSTKPRGIIRHEVIRHAPQAPTSAATRQVGKRRNQPTPAGRSRLPGDTRPTAGKGLG